MKKKMSINDKPERINLSYLDLKLDFKLKTTTEQLKTNSKLKKFQTINYKYFCKESKEESIPKKVNHVGKKAFRCASVFKPDQRPKLESLTNTLKSSRDLSFHLSNNPLNKKNLILTKDILTLEKEDNNLWFWCYNDIKCLRDSCKMKNDHLGTADSNMKKDDKIKLRIKDSDIKSPIKEMELKRGIDLSKHAFFEFKSLNPSRERTKFNFKSRKISEKYENFYKLEQENYNRKNFSKIEIPKIPLELKLPNTKKGFQNYMNHNHDDNTFKSHNTAIEKLKILQVDKRYRHETGKMIFNPDSNSFACYDFYDWIGYDWTRPR